MLFLKLTYKEAYIFILIRYISTNSFLFEGQINQGSKNSDYNFETDGTDLSLKLFQAFPINSLSMSHHLGQIVLSLYILKKLIKQNYKKISSTYSRF